MSLRFRGESEEVYAFDDRGTLCIDERRTAYALEQRGRCRTLSRESEVLYAFEKAKKAYALEE